MNNEPVAWICKTRGKIIKCEDEKIYPFKAWSQSNIALYSQEYVNQLLGEIEGLKKQLNKTDALIDQAFSNGAGASFNCDTHEDLAKIQESRRGYLGVLNDSK